MRKLTQELINFYSNRDAYMGWNVLSVLCPNCKSGYLVCSKGKAFCQFCHKEVKPDV